MGRTTIDVEIENYDDIVLRKAARTQGKKVRAIKVHALVDTGSALLCLPKASIEKLGLSPVKSATVRTGNGVVSRKVYRAVCITILGRQCLGEVMEVPDKVPPLLGFIPLENLDLVIDPKSSRVMHNPENGGKYTLDLL